MKTLVRVWESVCTTCGHPTPMHIHNRATGERFCTINMTRHVTEWQTE